MVLEAYGDILTSKRVGGWKSTAIGESDVDDLIDNKIELSKRLFPLKKSTPSTSTENTRANTSNIAWKCQY